MRDDFVIPIDDVERAIGAEVDRDGTEPFVGGGQKVGELFVAIARAVGGRRGADGVDRVGDRVGQKEDLGAIGGRRAVAAEKSVAILGEREAAEAGAAHLRRREGRRHQRLIRAQAILRPGGDPDAGLVGNHGITDVVGLLEKRLALARGDEAPDVVGAGREAFEARAVRGEAAEFALVKRDLGRAIGEGPTVGAADFRVVEKPLRREDLATGLTLKLMGKEVRVLRAEAGEDHVVAVGAAIGVGVPVVSDIGAVLNERTVFVGQQAERHHEPIGEDARGRGHGGLAGRRRGVGCIEDDDLVATSGGKERIGRGLLLVAIDGIFEGGHRPQPHAGIPIDGDKLAETGRLGGDEFNFKARRQHEGKPFLLGRAWAGGDRVVGNVAWRCGRGCRFGGAQEGDREKGDREQKGRAHGLLG